MANTYFWETQSRQRALKMVHLKVTIGASGAPTVVTDASLGVASVVRTSAGLYRITLTDKFTSLVGMECEQLHASIQQHTRVQLVAETVATTKLIDVWTLAPTSSSVTTLIATDPASASTLYFTFYLKNTSV